MRRPLALALLLLAACQAAPPAPPPTVWIGRSEADLIAEFGLPPRSYQAEGRRFVAYDSAGPPVPVVVPSLGFGIGSASGSWGSAHGFGTGLGIAFGPGGTTGPCTTTFEIRDGVVVGAVRQGPGCG